MRYVVGAGRNVRDELGLPMRREVLRQQDFVTRSFDIQIRCVCRACNQGWMSDLESRTRPVLEPMIRGETVQIDPITQDLLAQWSLKTLAMLHFIHPKAPFFPTWQLRTLYEKGTSPSGIVVWAAGCCGTLGPTEPLLDFFFYDAAMAAVQSDGGQVPLPYRYFATVRVDHVAFQLAGTDDRSRAVPQSFDHGYWTQCIFRSGRPPLVLLDGRPAVFCATSNGSHS